jgi:hypothetical protein
LSRVGPQGEERLGEQVGHRHDHWAGVEAIAVLLKSAGPAADLQLSLEDNDVVPSAAQVTGCGEAG